MKMFTLLQAGEVVEVAPVATNEAVETVAEVAVNDPESATETPTQSTGGGMSMWIMLALMFAVMYFFMIRPQKKQQKELQNFRDSLKKGDKVVTIGGIYGTVVEIKDASVLIEVDNSVKIRVSKQALVKDFSEQQ
jgi:preprotein translocase subunit YajC